jgi:hypothetical protein
MPAGPIYSAEELRTLNCNTRPPRRLVRKAILAFAYGNQDHIAGAQRLHESHVTLDANKRVLLSTMRAYQLLDC